MDQSLNEPTGDIRKYLRTLRTRKWSIVLTTILVVSAALGFSYLQTPIYEAEARLLVQPLSSPGSVAAQPVDIQTESQLIDSEPVALLVQEELDIQRSPQALVADLTVAGASPTTTVTSFSSSQVLLLRYASTSAQFASDAVNSFAENYIEYRRDQALDSYLVAQDAVEQRIQSATNQLDQVTNQLDAATRSGDDNLANTLETQRSIVISRLGVLQQRLDDLQPNQAARTGGAQVIQPGRAPGSPASPNFVTNGALAALVGLCLGIGIAFLRERLDDRFRGRDDVEEALEAPVLATVPKFAPSKRRGGSPLVTASETKGVASEAYRSLRTNLQFVLGQRGIKSLVVTSPSAGEGKTVTTANLAISLAQAGLRVIAVSADLRRPTLDKHFGVDKRHGLSTFLEGADQSPRDVVRDPGISNLRLVASGPIPESPAELLVSPRLGQLLDFLEANSDLVLIDTPPVLAVADAAILASRVGGTVLVINATSTPRSASVHAKEQLERGGGELIGTVLNAFDPQSSPYYYAPYYYSSTYESDSEPGSSNGEPGDAEATPGKRSRSLFGFRR